MFAMCRLFIEKISVLIFVCFVCVESSQYGVLSEPSHASLENEDFNKSAKHAIEPRWSLPLVETTNEGKGNDIRIFKDTTIDKQFNFSVTCLNEEEFSIKATSYENTKVLQIIGNKNMTFKCEQTETNKTSSMNSRWIHVQKQFNLTLQSGIIGVSNIVFELNDVEVNDSYEINGTAKINVLVAREISAIDTVFLITVYFLEILEMLTFGTQLDFNIITETLKTPIPPLIGLLCQYICMPLVS